MLREVVVLRDLEELAHSVYETSSQIYLNSNQTWCANGVPTLRTDLPRSTTGVGDSIVDDFLAAITTGTDA